MKRKTFIIICMSVLLLSITSSFAGDTSLPQYITKIQYYGDDGDFYVIGESNWACANFTAGAYYGEYVGNADNRKEVMSLILSAWSSGKKVSIKNKDSQGWATGSNYWGFDYVIIQD